MKTKKFNKIKTEAVKKAVKWLWKNRDNGGCYYFPCWVEPEWMEDVSPTDYNLVPNPHAGREWCVVIGWHDVGGKDEYPELYQDDHWIIQAGIRYQNRNNGMQCDYDIDWTMPYPCNWIFPEALGFPTGRRSRRLISGLSVKACGKLLKRRRLRVVWP